LKTLQEYKAVKQENERLHQEIATIKLKIVDQYEKKVSRLEDMSSSFEKKFADLEKEIDLLKQAIIVNRK